MSPTGSSRTPRVLVLLAVASVACPAMAQDREADGAGKLILPLEVERSNPSTRTPPSPDDLSREYPPLALAMNLSGRATVTCRAEVDGRVDECRINSEQPAGLGFGAAAVRMTAYMSMKPATIDGQAIAAPITVPFNFKPFEAYTATPLPKLPPASPEALAIARRIVATEDLDSRLQEASRPLLERATAAVAVDGAGPNAAGLIDTLRLGLDDAAAEEVEMQAHILASDMPLEQLAATAAFLESPAGKAWRAADVRGESERRDTFARRVAAAVHRRACTGPGCGGSTRAGAVAVGQ